MAVGGENLPVVGQGAIGLAGEDCRRTGQRRAARDAHVDGVAADRRRAGQQQLAADILQRLFRGQLRFVVEPAEAGHAARDSFESERIVQRAAEHLQAAADADQLAAVAQVATDGFLPALGA